MNNIYSQLCQVENHMESPVLGYCLNTQCQNASFFCKICQSKIHQNHQNDLLLISDLPIWIDQRIKSYEIIFQFMNEITELQKLLANYINPLLVNPNINLQNINTQNLLKIIQKLQIVQNCDASLIKLINQASIILQQIKKESLQFESINQKNNIIELKDNKFKFSHQLKHHEIYIEKNGQFAQGNYFVACQPIIPKYGITKLCIKFSGQNIFLGVCHKELINQASYSTEKLNNIGHGAYLIRNNGYVYSNLQKEINCTKQKFQFNSGQIIIIEIDMNEKKIDWINGENKYRHFSMKIDTNKDLYYFVHLFNCNVEILENC